MHLIVCVFLQKYVSMNATLNSDKVVVSNDFFLKATFNFCKYNSIWHCVDVKLKLIFCLSFCRGIKRAISNETPDDVNDLQPCFKARRKLSLPPNPVYVSHQMYYHSTATMLGSLLKAIN